MKLSEPQSDVNLNHLLGCKIVGVRYHDPHGTPATFYIRSQWGRLIQVTGTMKLTMVDRLPPEAIKET